MLWVSVLYFFARGLMRLGARTRGFAGDKYRRERAERAVRSEPGRRDGDGDIFKEEEPTPSSGRQPRSVGERQAREAHSTGFVLWSVIIFVGLA